MNRHALSYGFSDDLTAEDLRAYRAGQLRGAALHRVERLLLENPFYADALDGLDALQQAGISLQTHTRDLHEALQERVEETATPRRLMPLWVTSAAASIVLVICVAIYHFFYVLPTKNVPGMDVPAAAIDGIEPGTVLIDSKALGLGADAPAKTTIAQPEVVSVSQKMVRASKPRTQPRRAVAIVEKSTPIETTTTLPVAQEQVAVLESDPDIMPLPISKAEVQRRQTVDTERAFLN